MPESGSTSGCPAGRSTCLHYCWTGSGIVSMKRAGIGLSFAAALGLIACASEDLDQPPPGGTAGRGAGGNHASNGGRGGSSPSGTTGGQASHGGTTASIGGTSSNNAG